MKIQVTITNLNKAATMNTTLNATVGPADTVFNVQELIASLTGTFSFPDQKLIFNGKALPVNNRLSECGIKDGDAVEFQFQASEKTLIQQLSELIGSKSVSCEELGLLYSYRFGVSFEDAFKALGNGGGKLRGFLESHKCFCLHGDGVKLAPSSEKASQPSPALSPIEEDQTHSLLEVCVTIEVRVDGKPPELLSCDEDEDVYMRLEASETVTRTKDIFAASQQMPFPNRELWLGDQQLDNKLSLDAAGVKNGSILLMVVHASEKSLASQLEDLLKQRTALSPSELGLHYCQRFGTPVSQALRTLGLHANLRRFLEGHTQFSITGGCVTLTDGPKLVTPPAKDASQDSVCLAAA